MPRRIVAWLLTGIVVVAPSAHAGANARGRAWLSWDCLGIHTQAQFSPGGGGAHQPFRAARESVSGPVTGILVAGVQVEAPQPWHSGRELGDGPVQSLEPTVDAQS